MSAKSSEAAKAAKAKAGETSGITTAGYMFFNFTVFYIIQDHIEQKFKLNGNQWTMMLNISTKVESLTSDTTRPQDHKVSVLIIWFNKYAFQAGFRWNISLTALHFFVTFLGLEISMRFFGMFQPKRLSLMEVLPISLAFCGFVGFNNLSLQFNPVGVYQLLKVLTTPVIIVFQYMISGATLPTNQLLSLVPTCIGVILATVTHLDTNFWGLVFGTLGIFSTSLYQIWVKSEQERLKVSPQQLLHNQSITSCIMLIFLAPLLEDVWTTEDSLMSMRWFNHNTITWVGLSSVFAFCVNLSIFLVIGKTSAVSYNVLGHAKLCCILVSGYVIFQEPATAKNIAGVWMAVCGEIQTDKTSPQGVCMAVCGIMWYTELKLKANAPKKAA